MNNNRRSSIDGFVPRRPQSQIGDHHRTGASRAPVQRKELKSAADTKGAPLGVSRPGRQIGQTDLRRSLDNIPDDSTLRSRPLSRREKRRQKKAARTRTQVVRRRIITVVAWLLVAVLVGVAGFLGYKALTASGHVLNGNFLDILTQHQPLKEDEHGRSNFLILGSSEDDPGHEAGYLTDSIMVLSINQTKKDAYMFSIPRDLYVEYGMACISGYRGKINEYFHCSNDGETAADEQDRLAKARNFIGDILGMDLQYAAHVNYTVMRDVVNAIGGEIKVTIKSRNPLGVMDSNFDWKCGPRAQRRTVCPPDGHFIQYPNGEVTLDAEHALYLAQARGDIAPTYGFEQSNFDRERNQQMILVAIRDKAMSAGTFTNLGAITGLIDALGNNLRTNIETKEIRTLMDLAQHIDSKSIKSLDFYSDDNAIFTTGTIPGAGSSVYPAAGVGDYSELQAFINEEINAEPFMKEHAQIMVLNGSGEAGVAQRAADSLEEKGFTIASVDNAPDSKQYGTVTIYQLTTDAPATAAKLAQLYGVTPKTGTPPVSVTGETDFVVIIGDASAVR